MATAKKYGVSAAKSVEREMKAMKEGKLKSGSGATVTNPKQAIAIGLSEARKAGGKLPPDPTRPAKKAAAKKTVAKKVAKKSAKKTARKSARKAAKKSTS